jgi:hypothetical protein
MILKEIATAGDIKKENEEVSERPSGNLLGRHLV